MQDGRVAMQVRRGIPGCRSFAHANQGYALLAAGMPEGLLHFQAATTLLASGCRGRHAPAQALPTMPAGLEVARGWAGALRRSAVLAAWDRLQGAQA